MAFGGRKFKRPRTKQNTDMGSMATGMDNLQCQAANEKICRPVDNSQMVQFQNIETHLKTIQNDLAAYRDLQQQLSNVSIENALLKEEVTAKADKILSLESGMETLQTEK